MRRQNNAFFPNSHNPQAFHHGLRLLRLRFHHTAQFLLTIEKPYQGGRPIQQLDPCKQLLFLRSFLNIL